MYLPNVQNKNKASKLILYVFVLCVVCTTNSDKITILGNSKVICSLSNVEDKRMILNTYLYVYSYIEL